MPQIPACNIGINVVLDVMWLKPRGGGDSHMEQMGMLVINFEFNPKRRPSGRGSSFL